jgi:membrane protein
LAVRRSFVEFDGDNAWDWAAALTYYALLAIFPGLLVAVSVVGLVRPSSMEPLTTSLNDIAPGPTRIIIDEAIRGLQDSPQQAGFFAVVGIVVALWSACGYAGAFIRAANAAYDVPEGRPIWKTLSLRLGITIATGTLLAASAVIVLVTGNLSSVLGRELGLESSTMTAWSIGKWPLLVVLVSLMFAVLYWASPNARQSGFRWVSPGGAIAVVLWMAASAGFGAYTSHFASYDKTYGTLAGVVVFLTWMWITNLALLFGLEIDSELERQRAIAAGLPCDAEPYMRLREDVRARVTSASGLATITYEYVADPIDDQQLARAVPPPVRRPQLVMAGFMLGLAVGIAAVAVRNRARSR